MTHAPYKMSGRPERPSRPRQGGVVLVITILALILLASLVFYVLNLGRETNARIDTQHAADATAVGAAGHVARSLNTVAMNNVAISRDIALVNVLDSLPLAVDMTVKDPEEGEYDDLQALAVAVPAQIRRGVTDWWFKEALATMDFEVVEQDGKLKELDEFFRAQPEAVTNMTFYNAPHGGRGHIWRAMYAANDISITTMENLQLMTHVNASEAGMANLPKSGPGAVDAAAVAAVPELPWERGRFHDFERPVLQGLLPSDVDDKEYNRGPYDAVFGWRHVHRWSSRTRIPGQIGGGTVPPPAGTPGPDPDRYHVFGTQEWMLRRIPYYYLHRLETFTRILTGIKSNYLWRGTPIQYVIDPMWEVDIKRDGEVSKDENDECTYDVADNTPSLIKQTMFVVCEAKSRTQNNPLSRGTIGSTWDYVNRSGHLAHPVMYPGGRAGVVLADNQRYGRRRWRDPRVEYVVQRSGNGPARFRLPLDINRSGRVYELHGTELVVLRPKVNDYKAKSKYTWRISMERPAPHGDMSIGIPPAIRLFLTPEEYLDLGLPEGTPVYAAGTVRTIYLEIDLMLVGVNVGPEIEVRNPHAGFNPRAESSPAPIDLVHSQVAHDDFSARREYLTVLGVAQQNDTALFWPSRFDAGKPYPFTVGIAQAKVFNNHSWDLWTQMWHAQLEPVSEFDQWSGALGRYPNDAPHAEYAADLQTYMESIEPLAELLLVH